MNEFGSQEYLPNKLVRYLVYLWIALINVGVDFGLLLKATRLTGVVILLTLFTIAVLFSIYWTRALVDLFRNLSGDEALGGRPEIV